jgi:hypothetical protein
MTVTAPARAAVYRRRRLQVHGDRSSRVSGAQRAFLAPSGTWKSMLPEIALHEGTVPPSSWTLTGPGGLHPCSGDPQVPGRAVANRFFIGDDLNDALDPRRRRQAPPR